jgi:hypothetical protein
MLALPVWIVAINSLLIFLQARLFGRAGDTGGLR